MEKTYIAKGQTVKAQSFVEHICLKNHLENYFGAISMAFENLLYLANSKLFVSFSHCKDGICFTFTSDDCVFKNIDFEDVSNDKNKQIFTLKALSDCVKVSKNGDSLKMYFFTDPIEEELVISRKEKISAYLHKKVTLNK